MLHIISNRRQIYNKLLMDYCKKSTDESIQRIVERHSNKNKINFTMNDYPLNKSLVSGGKSFAIFVSLSLSSIVFFFYNRK
jgi:hypothetical protein